MFKKSIVISTLILSSQLFAGDLVESAYELKLLSAKILKIAERLEYGNSGPNAEQRLKAQVTRLIRTGKNMRAQLGGGSGGPGGPSDPRPPRGVQYSAKCHIDDDSMFDYNQNVVDVRSYSVQGLISDCKEMAQAMFPSRTHSSGILNVVADQAVRGMQTGRCHIDDDTMFDFDQIDIGTLYGNSIVDIIQDCKAIAQDTYKSSSSSGLKTVNKNNPVPHGLVSGTCHIDDDTMMDFNQFVPGVVFGQSIQAISADCKALAYAAFGSSSSHGMKDIKY